MKFSGLLGHLPILGPFDLCQGRGAWGQRAQLELGVSSSFMTRWGEPRLSLHQGHQESPGSLASTPPEKRGRLASVTQQLGARQEAKSLAS